MIFLIISDRYWKLTSSDYTNKGIPIIRIQNLGNNSREVFVYWDKEYDKKYIVKKGDILLSLSGTIPVSFKTT